MVGCGLLVLSKKNLLNHVLGYLRCTNPVHRFPNSFEKLISHMAVVVTDGVVYPGAKLSAVLCISPDIRGEEDGIVVTDGK